MAESQQDLIPRPDPSKLTEVMGRDVEKRSKEYTDLKIDVLEQRFSDMDRATKVLDETVHRTPTEIQTAIGHLRELIYAEIGALRAALTVAETEREKAAQALSEEREKAAQALAASLKRQIEDVYSRLLDHVTQQVEQLRGLIESVRREAALIQDSSERAVSKAEELNRERWEGNQIWRDRAADRERAQQEALAKLSTTFLRQDTADAQFERLRENADAQFGELRRTMQELSDKINKVV